MNSTATPCRHGPPLSVPIVGEVIGFDLRWAGQRHGGLLEILVRRLALVPDDVRVIALTKAQVSVATALAGRRQQRGSGSAAVAADPR